MFLVVTSVVNGGKWTFTILGNLVFQSQSGGPVQYNSDNRIVMINVVLNRLNIVSVAPFI